jgi:RNA polymerase-binding transcription factor DksA
MDRIQEFNDDHVADSLKRHQAQRPPRSGLTHCETLDCREPIGVERTAQGARLCDDCQEEHDKRSSHFAAWARR